MVFFTCKFGFIAFSCCYARPKIVCAFDVETAFFRQGLVYCDKKKKASCLEAFFSKTKKSGICNRCWKKSHRLNVFLEIHALLLKS